MRVTKGKGWGILIQLLGLTVGLVLVDGSFVGEPESSVQEGEVCLIPRRDPTQTGCQRWLWYSDLPNPYPKTTPLSLQEAFELM